MSTPKITYARPTTPLEVANYEKRQAVLKLPRDADELSEGTARGVVGGMAAIQKAAVNNCLTQEALAKLRANQRPWYYCYLVTEPTSTVDQTDSTRIEALNRRVKGLTKKLTDGAARLHRNSEGGALTSMTRKLAKEAKEVLHDLEGKSWLGSSPDGMVKVGLARPEAVTLLASSVAELAFPATQFLQTVSLWRDAHVNDWFSGGLKRTAQDAEAILDPLIHLSHRLTDSSPAGEVVRSLVPDDVGEHDILRLVQSYEYVQSKHPEIELTKISQTLGRLLTELEPFGSELAKSRFILAQWGHLLPRASLENPTPYALLASVLEAVACATSTGEIERDPFDRLLGPKASGREGQVALPAPTQTDAPTALPAPGEKSEAQLALAAPAAEPPAA